VKLAGASLGLAFLLEGARIGLEAWATWMLYGESARLVPGGALARAQLAAYAVSSVMPAGRLGAEALKAAILSRYVGMPRAAAVGTMIQALSLVSTAILSIPCALAVWATGGPRWLLTGVLCVTVTTGAAGVGIPLLANVRGAASYLTRRLPRIGAVVERYQMSLRELRLTKGGPLLVMASARALQLLSLGILAKSLGAASVFRATLVAGGVHMVAISAGDLVPGQLGVTDGAFAIAAPTLGLSLAGAVAIALLSHGVQLVWCAAGAVTPLLGRGGRGDEGKASRGAALAHGRSDLRVRPFPG
jgi:hypothetical protein